MESFTAEQKEYLERRFSQLTAAMVRPTTTDQAAASGSLADVPAQGDNGKHIYCLGGIERSSTELGLFIQSRERARLYDRYSTRIPGASKVAHWS